MATLQRELFKKHHCDAFEVSGIDICGATAANGLGVSSGEGDLGSRTPGGHRGDGCTEALGAWGNTSVTSKSSNRRGHRATAAKWHAIVAIATGEGKKFAPRAMGDGVEQLVVMELGEIMHFFAFLRFFSSPSGQRWQWEHSEPFLQPPGL